MESAIHSLQQSLFSLLVIFLYRTHIIMATHNSASDTASKLIETSTSSASIDDTSSSSSRSLAVKPLVKLPTEVLVERTSRKTRYIRFTVVAAVQGH